MVLRKKIMFCSVLSIYSLNKNTPAFLIVIRMALDGSYLFLWAVRGEGYLSVPSKIGICAKKGPKNYTAFSVSIVMLLGKCFC
jgi:hypothetical protein